MFEHFERLYSPVHVEFMQIELVRNTLFPTAERVESDQPAEAIVAVITDTPDWPPNQNS